MSRTKTEFCYFVRVSILCLSLFLNGCATQEKSAGLGGAIGAGTGTALGGILDPGRNGEYRTRNVIVGAALGGATGMVAGAVIHQNNEKEKREAFLKGQASPPSSQKGVMPSLKPARVESQWIEGHPVGTNRWVEGHFEHLIVEQSRWEDQ